MVRQDTTQLSGQEQLLLSVVEQLSRPLLQMSHLAELAQSGEPTLDDWKLMHTIAQSSLQLVESYSLSLRLQGKLTALEMEPLAVSSLLYDAAHLLDPVAKQYGVTLELDAGPRMTPIYGDRQVLQSVLTSLGHVFIASGAEQDTPVRVRLSAHRGRYGVVTGLYSSLVDLGTDSLRQARQLHGTARQPLQRLISGPAAGVFVADSLLASLQSRLHVARYHKLSGLAATLLPSQQLRLV